MNSKFIQRSSLCNKGFSLVEVMVAVMVLGIGIVSIASMQTASIKGAKRARMTSKGTVAAGGQLERILAMTYGDPQLVDRDGAYQPEKPDHGPFDIKGSRGTIAWEVDDDFPTLSTKRITVFVRQPGKVGGMQSIRYDYIKAKGYAP